MATVGRSQSMPKLGRSPSRPGRPSTGPSWPKRPAGSAHGRTQKDGSGAGLQKTGSFSRLQKSDSFAHVPQAVRLEFYRYSTPLKGPMGRMNVHQVSKNFKFYGYVEELECRSVTVEQVLQIKNYAVGNCYAWSIPASTLNFYHIHEWMVRPATRELNSAMMEHLSERKLLPNWFISHYWGEHLEKFLEGVRQHLAVRGLSGRTGYWLGAFATRHTDFTDTGTFSPHVWSKVAEAAHFRLLLVLNSTDLKNPAPALARSWCAFECALCLDCTALSMDVASVRAQDVQVLTCGLTSSEICSSKYCPGVGLHLKQRREVSFPVEVAEAPLRFALEKTEASKEEDREKLLRSLAVPEGEEEEVETYQRMTRRLRSMLLLVFWPFMLCNASSEKKQLLSDMAKAIQGDYWRKSLTLNLGGCDFSKKEILQLALNSLPPNLEWLKLDFQFSKLEDLSLPSLARVLPPNLHTLFFNAAGCGITDRGVFSFLGKLPQGVTKVTMRLQHTKVSPGLLELSKDGPTALQKWAKLSYSERADALKEKLEVLERKKNPLAAPHPSQVNRKMALESLALLPPQAIAEHVRHNDVNCT